MSDRSSVCIAEGNDIELRGRYPGWYGELALTRRIILDI